MVDERTSESPPFTADVNIGDDPGEIAVALEVVPEVSTASTAFLAERVDAFAVAAQARMFSRAPAIGTTPLQAVKLEGTETGRLRYNLRARGVQHGAYRVLLGMLARCHYTTTPLELVRLVSAAGGRRVNGPALMAGAFPGRGSQVPFEVHLGDDLPDFKQPTIRLEFQRDISDAEMEKLVPLFVAWDGLNAWGGYVETFAETALENLPWSQETHLAARDTVEHSFYGIVGPVAAFDALINMAIYLHHTFCPLKSFEVE